jgi:hypothetical protein
MSLKAMNHKYNNHTVKCFANVWSNAARDWNTDPASDSID